MASISVCDLRGNAAVSGMVKPSLIAQMSSLTINILTNDSVCTTASGLMFTSRLRVGVR